MGSEKRHFWKNAYGVILSEEIEKLNELSDFFRKMNAKIILLRFLKKAKSEYDKFNFEECRKSLIKAYFADKKNPVVYRGLGCINQFRGKFNSAVRYFNTGLKYSDKKEIEYTLLGMVYYLQGKLDDAIIYFNLAIDVNDDYSPAYEGRNQSLLENHLKVIDLQESLKKQF